MVYGTKSTMAVEPAQELMSLGLGAYPNDCWATIPAEDEKFHAATRRLSRSHFGAKAACGLGAHAGRVSSGLLFMGLFQRTIN